MANKGKRRDPLEGIPYGVNALIRNEGTTVEQVLISEIDTDDKTFCVRAGRHMDLMVESLKASGQLTPMILRYREKDGMWQIVSGFRRFEALIQLGKKSVNARQFDVMSDDEAIRLSVMDNFFSGDLNGDHLDAYFDRLQQAGLLTPTSTAFLDWAREKIAAVTPNAPIITDDGDRDITADLGAETDALPFNELIQRTFSNLSDAAQGLEKIFLNWSDVSPSDRKILAAECKYIHDIYPFLTR